MLLSQSLSGVGLRSRPEVFAAALVVLEHAARERGTVRYKELNEQVPGLSTRGPVMTKLLLDISDHPWQANQVLLPVLVVNASGAKLPSTGCYESLAQFRPDDDQSDKVVAARRERERVFRAYPRPPS